MTRDRLLILAVVILAIVALAVVFDFSCAADVQTVEVTPATQPIETANGQIVLPPPAVKVEGGWTPGNVITVASILAAIFAGTMVPAIILIIRALKGAETTAQNAASTANAAAGQTAENTHRLDRQGERLSGMESKLPPAGPHERV